MGVKNEDKTQCLLFSATTPPWVKEIGRQYQEDALSIDSTSKQQGARTATTVRHTAVQVPPGSDAKKAVLEDIIAVEISKDADLKAAVATEVEHDNPIAAAAIAEKGKGNHAVQQKVFGKTIVFTQTKREADELVSGGIFKSLTAQVSNMMMHACMHVILVESSQCADYISTSRFNHRLFMAMLGRSNVMPL